MLVLFGLNAVGRCRASLTDVKPEEIMEDAQTQSSSLLTVELVTVTNEDRYMSQPSMKRVHWDISVSTKKRAPTGVSRGTTRE